MEATTEKQEIKSNPMAGLMAMMFESSAGISKRLLDRVDKAKENHEDTILVSELQEIINNGFSDVTKDDSITNKIIKG